MGGQQSSSQKILLGYWNIPFRGHIIRFLLEYVQLGYTEKIYDIKNMDCWMKTDKPSIGHPFPNLPYIIDGDYKLSETLAIASYIAEKGGQTQLLGVKFDKHTVSEVSGVANDTIGLVSQYFSNPDKRNDLLKSLSANFDALLEFIGNKEWAVGYLTIADFFIYSTLKQAQAVLPDKFQERYKNKFSAYQKRFEAIPQIDKYIKSEKYINY